MRRLLGLDIGQVRIGVALSDPLGLTAQPLEVIHRPKTHPLKRIAELVEEYEVERVIVGNPLRLDGSEGQATATVDAFVEKLGEHLSVPIELWDERMTTAAAERVMIAGGARRDKRRQNIDKLAASLILQSYLDAKSISSADYSGMDGSFD